MRFALLCWMLALACVAPTFAQTPQQPANKTLEYVLGAGDIIRVSVYQNPDLSLETRISELGQITFPLVGNVSVGGASVSSAQDRIAKQLRDGGFVLKPQVNVMLVQARSSQVSILGQVSKPGRYPIETVNSKVSEMIATAGGVLPAGADVVTLTGVRNGAPVKLSIDLPSVFQGGKADLDVVVANGDTLFVDRAATFYIYGEVQKPGVYRLERGMTVLQALAQGGGLTQRGTERGLRLHRRDASNALKITEPGMNDVVERDDVIYVRESLF